jgi:putative membrane protein
MLLNGKGNVKYEVYSDIDSKRMILRDHLATDRTILANQNTFLAYLRTALTLFVAGVTFIRFFDYIVIETIGWLFIPAGIITSLLGVMRYVKLRSVLSKLKK